MNPISPEQNHEFKVPPVPIKRRHSVSEVNLVPTKKRAIELKPVRPEFTTVKKNFEYLSALFENEKDNIEASFNSITGAVIKKDNETSKKRQSLLTNVKFIRNANEINIDKDALLDERSQLLVKSAKIILLTKQMLSIHLKDFYKAKEQGKDCKINTNIDDITHLETLWKEIEKNGSYSKLILNMKDKSRQKNLLEELVNSKV